MLHFIIAKKSKNSKVCAKIIKNSIANTLFHRRKHGEMLCVLRRHVACVRWTNSNCCPWTSANDVTQRARSMLNICISTSSSSLLLLLFAFRMLSHEQTDTKLPSSLRDTMSFLFSSAISFQSPSLSFSFSFSRSTTVLNATAKNGQETRENKE